MRELFSDSDVGSEAQRRTGEHLMTNKLLALAAAAGMIAGLTTGATAQSTTSPGQQMQEKGSVTGSPGASGYAPGQQMQQNGSVKGTTGASGYAPGQNRTTGATINSNTDVKAGGAKAKTGVGGGAKIK
jgi:hypothetical protein